MFPKIYYILYRINELKLDVFLADISAFRIPISEFVHMDVS